MAKLIRKRETLLFAIIVAMIVVFSTRAADFATPDNLAGIFNDTAILIILALAQMTVILTKSIDLSVAANLAFTGMAIAMMNAAYPDLPLVVLILAAIMIGAALGTINGFLVWRLEIPPIVVTLGTLTIYRGMALCSRRRRGSNAHS
ncbi:ABC transporter permease, partial [Rhizobium sp. Pop5]|uniref:ABC transporter permease n=1 Tax=Rhizobium sp. Pop5 TaxID=1223565 RepID=UPI000B02F424